MANDHGRTERRAWLHALARRRLTPAIGALADRLGTWLLPTRRRRRALLRATLVRL